MINAPASSERLLVLQRTDREDIAVLSSAKSRTGLVSDSVLEQLAFEARLGRSLALPGNAAESVWDELAAHAVFVRGQTAPDSFGVPVVLRDAVSTNAATADVVARRGTGFQPVSEIRTGKMPVPRTDPSRQPVGFAARLAVILLAAGPCGYASGVVDRRTPRTVRIHRKTKLTASKG
jgi:hypothetical protein